MTVATTRAAAIGGDEGLDGVFTIDPVECCNWCHNETFKSRRGACSEPCREALREFRVQFYNCMACTAPYRHSILDPVESPAHQRTCSDVCAGIVQYYMDHKRWPEALRHEMLKIGRDREELRRFLRKRRQRGPMPSDRRPLKLAA